MKTFNINGQTVTGTGGSIAAVKRWLAANNGAAFSTIQVRDNGSQWNPGIRWIRPNGNNQKFFAAPAADKFTGPMSMLSIDGNIVVNLTDTQVVMRNEAFKQTITYTIV